MGYIIKKSVQELTTEVRQQGEVVLNLEQQLAGMQTNPEITPYDKEYLDLTLKLLQAEKEYNLIRNQYLRATKNKHDSYLPPTVSEIISHHFDQLPQYRPVQLNNNERSIYENITGVSADGETDGVTPDQKLGIIDWQLTKVLISQNVVGPLAKAIAEKAAPELLAKLLEPALTETAMGMLTDAAATDILTSVLIGMGATALGPEIVVAATIVTFLHDVSKDIEDAEEAKKRNYARRHFAYGITVAKEKPISLDTDFEYVRSTEPGLPVIKKVLGQNYSAETSYAGWSPDPESGVPTEMWELTPKHILIPTPEQQKKFTAWRDNKNFSQKITNPLNQPRLAAEYKPPKPQVQESQLLRASRGINLPFGDNFSGSWNAANQQIYTPIQKPVEKPRKPLIDNPTYSPGYDQVVGIAYINLHPALTGQAAQNNYQLQVPILKKTSPKAPHPKTQKKQPRPANLHPSPAAKDKSPQAIAAPGLHSNQHKAYHITINEVHGSHIKTQHPNKHEHSKITSEDFAGVINAAVIANQLHAG